MVDEPIKPCPVCGSQATARPQPDVAECAECGFTFGLDAWNRLSDAAALARAVERLGAWLKVDCNHMFELEYFPEHERHFVRQMIFSRSGWSGHACGVNPDLAAALIALAEQIEDTP